VDHRLFGTAHVVVVVSTGSALSGVGLWKAGSPGGWCLARCWVLKARAFFACLQRARLLVVPRSSSPLGVGLWLAPASGGVPPVF
jgi:hypothetical protein